MVSNLLNFTNPHEKLVILTEISDKFEIFHGELMQTAMPMLHKIKDKGGNFELTTFTNDLGAVEVTVEMDKKTALYVASGVNDDFRWELIEYIEALYVQNTILKEGLSDVAEKSLDPVSRETSKEALNRAEAIAELLASRTALRKAISLCHKRGTLGVYNNEQHAGAVMNIIICKKLTGNHTDHYKGYGGFPSYTRNFGSFKAIQDLIKTLKKSAECILDGISINDLNKYISIK